MSGLCLGQFLCLGHLSPPQQGSPNLTVPGKPEPHFPEEPVQALSLPPASFTGGFRQMTPHRLLKVVQDSSPRVRCQLLPCRLLLGRTLPHGGAPCLLAGSVPPLTPSLPVSSPVPLRVPHEHRPPHLQPGLSRRPWDIRGASDPVVSGAGPPPACDPGAGLMTPALSGTLCLACIAPGTGGSSLPSSKVTPPLLWTPLLPPPVRTVAGEPRYRPRPSHPHPVRL